MTHDRDNMVKESTERPPLAIVGIGCLFPKANARDAYWANITAGVDTVEEIPKSHWNPQDYFDADQQSPDRTYARRGSFLRPVAFDTLRFGISPNNIEATDTTHLLGLVVADQALRDAGYATSKDAGDGRPFNRDRTSVILGVTGTLELVIPLSARLGHPIWRRALRDSGVDEKVAEDVVRRIAHQYVPWQENSFPGLLGNVAAGRIANRFDVGGTNCAVDAACASSLSAIHTAAMELYAGRSDMAITGGLDTFNDIFMYMCFSKTPALSPTGDSRPFGHNADGTILGEGLGVVVLKRLADAIRDGDRIHALIRGIGTSSDGRGNAVYAPSAAGQIKALHSAYRESNVTPDTIELVEAHGTGTKVGDGVEIEALCKVFGESRALDEARREGPWCAIGSVKSMIGHTKAAAGVAGLIKAALALENKVLPPTLKVTSPCEALSGSDPSGNDPPLYINTLSRPWLSRKEHPRRAAVSAFGFGGSNYHCVLEEAQTERETATAGITVAILPFCAASKSLLMSALTDQLDSLNAKQLTTDQAWDQLRATSRDLRATFDSGAAHRTLLVVERGKTDLAKLLRQAIDAIKNSSMNKGKDGDSWQTPDGAYGGSGIAAGEIAVLFPGQGSQFVGMLRELACTFPEMLESLTLADSAFAELNHEVRLSDVIYPIPAFDEKKQESQHAALQRTDAAQPAIGATSLGAWRVLQRFGVTAKLFAGHSFGELVALCAAQRMTDVELFRLAIARGEAMQNASTGRGSMLAVISDRDVVAKLIDSQRLDLVIANHNGPRQVVVSGSLDPIAQAEEAFREQKIRTVRLNVSAAFHSSEIEPASRQFAETVARIHLQPGVGSVFANATAAVYPNSSDEAGRCLIEQITSPVRFVEQIEAMVEAGAKTFLEVGPGNVLSGLVESILGDRPHHTISLNQSGNRGSDVRDLALLLCRLASLGVPIKLSAWDEQFDPSLTENQRPSRASVTISGANYVKPREPLPPSKNPVPREKPATPTFAAPVPSQRTDALRVAPTKPPANKTAKEQMTQESDSDRNPMKTTGATAGLPSRVPVSIAPNSEAMNMTERNILALQQMLEQTADLHRQYLDGQQAAQRSIFQLIEQQQQMLAGQPFANRQSVVSQSAAPVIQETPLTEPAPLVDLSPRETPVQPVARAPVVQRQEVTLPEGTAPIPEPVTSPESGDDLGDSYRQVLLEVISEKTGYPIEMLEPEMNIDTDLGIDSIKRVEILSAFQEKAPDAPQVKAEMLGSLQTIEQIVTHLVESTSGATISVNENSGATAGLPSSAVPCCAKSAAEDSAKSLISIPEEKTLGDRFAKILLEVVAEKTGYPIEMLELEMNLDSDLGIDSIKRVEILSAFQEKAPDAPEVKAEDLGVLQTLAQIVDYLNDTAGDSGGHLPTSEEPTRNLLKKSGATAGLPNSALGDAKNTSGQVNRGTPVSDLPLSQQASSGESNSEESSHDTVSFASLDRYLLGSEEVNRAAGDRILPDAKSEIWITATDDDLATRLQSSLSEANIPARIIAFDEKADADGPKPVSGLVLLAPLEILDEFNRQCFELLQTVIKSWRYAPESSTRILCGVSRMDGQFGLGGKPLIDVSAGGLAGLIKTAQLESPAVHCKSIDLDREMPTDIGASALLEELQVAGPLEVGLSTGHRVELKLEERAEIGSAKKLPLADGDVVVITGGGRGVTAEVAVEMARHHKGPLVLLGRTPVPAEEPNWLSSAQDEAEIKRALAAESVTKMTPRVLEEKYRKVSAQREITATLRRIESLGASAEYLSVDVRDADMVQAALANLRFRLGPIAGFVHGAGVLADKKIEDKTVEQFEHVYSTKVAGLNTLLEAMDGDELRLLLFFSSSTARFGRVGQCDYAVANEVLNKTAQHQSRIRPDARVVSINWGPWDGGMVNQALKDLFANEGVGVIDTKVGAKYALAELAAPTTDPVEIVVIGKLPKDAPPEENSSETADDKSQPVEANDSLLRIAFDIPTSVEEIPVLRSHVMNHRAVVPMALSMEWMAHAALHDNPGSIFFGMDDFQIFKGIIVDEDESFELAAHAALPAVVEGRESVLVELRSGKTLHARASVVLGDQPPSETDLTTEYSSLPDKTYPHPVADDYQQQRLFHGPMLQGIERITACCDEGIEAMVRTAPSPSEWILRPMRMRWIADPLALDCAFQMMILWSFQTSGAASLPTGYDRYRQFVRTFPAGHLRVVSHVTSFTEHSATADIEFRDDQDNLVALIEGYQCVIDPSLADAFARNTLAQQISS